MGSKKVLTVTAVTIAAACAIAASKHLQNQSAPQTPDPNLLNRTSQAILDKDQLIASQVQNVPVYRNAQSPQKTAIPQHIVYDELFYHVNFLKEKAEEIEKSNNDASELRAFYKNEARLSDEQNSALFEIAANCQLEVGTLDERAKQITKIFRANLQSRELQPGETPPPVPPELKKMQEERQAVVLRARNLLRVRFGDPAFQKFDEYVQSNIKSQIQIVPSNK